MKPMSFLFLLFAVYLLTMTLHTLKQLNSLQVKAGIKQSSEVIVKGFND